MRNLTINELNCIAGATIVNNVPSGTTIRGMAKELFDPNSGSISTVLLYGWSAKDSGSFFWKSYTNTPYYFNQNFLGNMPEISLNGYQDYNWEGTAP